MTITSDEDIETLLRALEIAKQQAMQDNKPETYAEYVVLQGTIKEQLID